MHTDSVFAREYWFKRDFCALVPSFTPLVWLGFGSCGGQTNRLMQLVFEDYSSSRLPYMSSLIAIVEDRI